MVEHWGKYRLERLLARGGMAEIFKASNIGPSGFVKPVCLKRVRVEFSSNPEFVEMFQSEARIAATLHHPNIVQVFDFDRHEGQLFLAMEYVEGLDLKQILTLASSLQLRVPISFAVHVTEGLLMALNHAHGKTVDGKTRPVIHRDVSPHNILVSEEGVVQLADFGIAKAEGISNVTREGVIKGKLAYLSPEQARGERAGPSMDLFGVGLVLWEMLAGHRLIGGNDYKEHMANLLNLKIPVLEGVSDRINDFVRCLLEPRPSDRFESAAAALTALGNTGVTPCGPIPAGELVRELKNLAGEPLPSRTQGEQFEKKGRTRVATNHAESAPDSTEAPAATRRAEPEPDTPEAPAATHHAEPDLGNVAAQAGLSPTRRLSPVAVVGAFVVGCLVAYFLFSMIGRTEGERPETAAVSTSPQAAMVGHRAARRVDGGQERQSVEHKQRPPVVHLSPEVDPDGGPQVSEDAGPVEVKPQRAATRTAATMGFIEINVRPWARVKVDGHDRGFTPVKNLKVKTGSHRILLENNELNYRKSFKVQVRPGKTAVLNKEIASPGNRSPR